MNCNMLDENPDWYIIELKTHNNNVHPHREFVAMGFSYLIMTKTEAISFILKYAEHVDWHGTSAEARSLVNYTWDNLCPIPISKYAEKARKQRRKS